MPLSHPLDPAHVEAFVSGLFASDLHAARLRSLSDGTLGVLHASELGIHAIGRGLAAVRGLMDRHAVKQVDRLLSNPALRVETLASTWVPAVLGSQTEAFVNLDWTESAAEDHSTLMASLQTAHGRSVPLLWKTVRTSELRGQRSDQEDALLVQLQAVMPVGVAVTVVADRGFGDQGLYRLLAELGWGYVIRFRGNIGVTSPQGETRPAAEWVGPRGRMRVLRHARVTAEQTEVGSVVVVQDPGMEHVWCLAVGDPKMSGSLAKQRYGKRFTCEELFRDLKDPRFGMGLANCAVSIPERRDRLLLLATLAQRLLTLLGEAGERAGLDRVLKTNTRATRSLSLLNQGLRWYDLIPRMPEARLRVLSDSFDQLLQEHPVFLNIFQAMLLGAK
jgi:hypothetical protein